MIEAQKLLNLACPTCGGIVAIVEGQIIVACPFCEQRSLVRGEKSVRRYQVEQRIDRKQAVKTMHKFLSNKMDIARDASRLAQIQDTFLAYIPFWKVTARVYAWVFGKVKGRRSDTPKEMQLTEDRLWSGIAGHAGDFGVHEINLSGRELLPYDPEQMHAAGMVFEPVGSSREAITSAEGDNILWVEENYNKGFYTFKMTQRFVRQIRHNVNLIYYPLWVIRYLYRERSYQVLVDGYDGQVLSGKAPGSDLFRAVSLVAGIAFGAFLMVAVTLSIILFGVSLEENILDICGGMIPRFIIACFPFISGLLTTLKAYEKFRFGGVFEYERKPSRVEWRGPKMKFSKDNQS